MATLPTLASQTAQNPFKPTSYSPVGVLAPTNPAANASGYTAPGKFAISSPQPSSGLLTSSNLTPVTSQASASVGLKATSPLTNIAAPTTTLPVNQTAKPVQTDAQIAASGVPFSQLTPAQQAIRMGTPQSSTSGGTNASQGGLSNVPSTGSYPAPAPSGMQYNANGQLVPVDTGTSTVQTTNTSNANGSLTATDPNGLYGQLIAQLQARSQAPSADYLAQQAQANQYNEALKQSRMNEAQGLASNASNPIPLEFQQGRAQVLQSQYAQEQAALGSAFQGAATLQGAANTQQGLEQQGLGTAAGFAQPVGQFGMLTNPLTGQPLNSGLLSGPVQQAVQLVKNGADPQGSAVQSLLSPLGLAGQSQFTAALQGSSGGTYNPSAQSAAVNQNVAQGTQAQGQAFQLDTALKQTSTIEPLFTSILSSSGINSTDSPLYNQPINNYLAKLGNPAAVAQYNLLLNSLQKFSSQIVGAGGVGTPTGVQAATDLQNPGNLSLAQIKYYLDTLKTDGGNQLSVLQRQTNSSYGGNVGQYSGNPANPSSGITVAPQSTAIGGGATTPGSQFVGGIALGAGSWALGQAKNLGGEVASFIAGLFAP